MTEIFSLAGQVALVTGASQGLGAAIAAALARAGAHVELCARNAEKLAAVAARITDAGGAAAVRLLDVSDEAAATDAVAAIAHQHGRLDILVNNAGVVHRAELVASETRDFQDVLDVNLTALYVLAREAAKPMAAQGRGRIINLGSIMSVLARPGIVAYVTSKHAVQGLTRALAVELGPKGITANAIGPGYFRTEINQPLQDDRDFSAMVETRTPVGRWGEPEELGAIAVFLASDAAAYINGHLLLVDGGLTAAL